MGAPDSPRLLAVDDEDLARSSYRGLLRRYGEPVVVATVREARRKLDEHQAWGAFLFDLRLDDGSGLDLLAYSRQAHPHTPALILSGHVAGWVANEAFDLGADTLAKPFELPRMHRWLERALGLQIPAKVGSGTAGLRERIEALRALVSRKAADIRTRYQIGQLVAELKARPDSYGDGAVTIAAAAVGQDEASLYRFARVAERWDEQGFSSLVSLKMRDGKRPTWSHVVALASITTESACKRVIERMLDENLSVRELDRIVSSGGAAGTSRAGDGQVP